MNLAEVVHLDEFMNKSHPKSITESLFLRLISRGSPKNSALTVNAAGTPTCVSTKFLDGPQGRLKGSETYEKE